MGKKYIAIDLGAESGRIIVGNLKEIDVVYRFPNYAVKIKDSIYWDILNIFNEIKKGLKIAFSKYKNEIKSIGVDTWGVDFALLDKHGNLIGNPYHYRDNRTDNIMDEVFSIIPREEVFYETGIQFMQINTIYQLYSFIKENPELYDKTNYFVTIPDLINYWLTGNITNEYSNATTTQLFNSNTNNWSDKIFDKLKINKNIFQDVTKPGTKIGALLKSLASEIGADENISVVAPACHDTGSAVAAVPVLGNNNYAYLSSGTWSLLGVESSKPIINEKSLGYNFTNEGAADGGVRFLKNIMGLWILQQCKVYWDRNNKKLSYEQLTKMAAVEKSSKFTINPNDPVFLKPDLLDDSMPDRIKEHCKKNNQYVPVNEAEIARGVLESLGEAYYSTLKEIEDINQKKVEELYVIGGGCQNSLLCQLTADRCRIPVYAGPVEATALGNIMVQMMADGELDSVKEGREVIRKNINVKEYLPVQDN